VSISVGGTAADDRGVNQVSWTNDRGGSGVATGTTSWSLTNVPLVNGTNVITVTAVDAAGNRGTDSLTVTYTGSTADTTLPTVSISGPTSGTTFTTTSSALALSGTSADNLGVTQVTWTNDRGGSGVATGTTSWSAPSIALQTGTNNITVRARDAAGNQGTDLLTITYTAPVTPPSGSVTLTGSASGNLTAQLSWTANSWSTVDVYRNGNQEWHTYNDGAHTDTVPSAGTYSYYICSHLSKTICSNTIMLTVTSAATQPPDTTAPTVSINGPTSASSYATTSSSMALSGTSADNLGVTQVTWTNDRGGNGVATGTTSWSVPSIALQTGTNNITVQARDAAGNWANDVVTVTYTVAPPPDTTVPTISISGPTSASSYAMTSSSMALSGTSADNLGVTQVIWTNDRGGSGVATGTTSWSVPSIALQTGTNNITVQARDAAGNQGTDLLTVTYTAPVTPPSGSVTLTGSASGNLTAQLSWTANSWSTVDVYRNGNQEWHTYNDGAHTDTVPSAGTYSYYICSHLSKTICSNTIVVTF
jgi:predicted xylose isomerase-like sugar epimerase